MRRNMFKSSIIALVAGMIFLGGTTVSIYAHDPATTQWPDKSHIHIKGTVATPEGKGIPGLVVRPQGPNNVWAVQGVPGDCGLSYNPGTTDSTGKYEVLVLMNSTPACRNAFDSITLDKTKLIISNPNLSAAPYDFKIK